jgi:integrase
MSTSSDSVHSTKVAHLHWRCPHRSGAIAELAIVIMPPRPDRAVALQGNGMGLSTSDGLNYNRDRFTCEIHLTVALAEAGRKASTLQRRLSSISQAHQAAGYPSPTHDIQVRTVWAGIRRVRGTKQEQVAPVVTEDLRAMIDALPDNLSGLRDRALLLVGFVCAFRRSELVSLDLEDIRATSEGLVITLHRSKTDQEGEGEEKALPYGSNPVTCPVRAVQDWTNAAGITSGPVFRPVNRHGQVGATRLTCRSVASIIKRAAERAGFDSTLYSGHSLRAGFATSAARAGAEERDIAQVTGHKSERVLRRYIRQGQLFRNPALDVIGL